MFILYDTVWDVRGKKNEIIISVKENMVWTIGMIQINDWLIEIVISGLKSSATVSKKNYTRVTEKNGQSYPQTVHVRILHRKFWAELVCVSHSLFMATAHRNDIVGQLLWRPSSGSRQYRAGEYIAPWGISDELTVMNAGAFYKRETTRIKHVLYRVSDAT